MTRPSAPRIFAVALGLAMLALPALARAQGADDPLAGLGDAPPSPKKTAARAPERDAGPAPAAPAASGPQRAPAADGDGVSAQLDRIKAVPRKMLLKRHRFELSPIYTMSLNDAYYQHMAAGGSAIFYPHDSFGMGVGAEYLFAHVATDNVDAVRQNLISVPGVFEKPWLFAHVDAYWVPIYGKLSLFSSSIIHFDTYVAAGGGLAFAGEHRRPAVNVGIGQRFVLADWLALRFELRDHMFVDTQEVNGRVQSDMQNYLLLTAGVSLFLPTSFEYSFQ